MADDVDMTQHLHDAALDGRVAAIRARTETVKMAPLDCFDCEEEIPEERRKSVPWTFRCVRCQTLAERVYGRRA